MEREFLFRGKRVDTGEWIYGDLIKHSIIDAFTYIAIGVGYKIDNPEIGKAIKILPNTVGQFTGTTDMNGKKVFDGDIIGPTDFGYDGVVYFDELIYAQCECTISDDIEIVGNIYDNPELI